MDETPASGRRKRRLRWWIAGSTGFGIVVLAAASPYLAALPPFRNMILRAALPEIIELSQRFAENL